ncbi:MAG: NAD(P)/FAD-dependent oxidoreductase [Vicinamibacterales bacterium]
MTPPLDAEVIVAGAGPAGAVAARALAAAGIDTLLLDRAAFPRNKPCGGGISTRATARFPWLAGALSRIDVHTISRLHLEGPMGAVMALESPRDCVMLVRRVEFDHALVQEAERAGARKDEAFEITQVEVSDNAVVLQSRDGRRRAARMVIAADGVHSVVAKRLGVNARWPRTHLALDMMEETPVDQLRATRPDVLWVAYAHRGLDGYAYVFPKTNHVNVGIGCLLSHYDDAVDARPYELQQEFVESLVDRQVLEGRSDRRCFTPFLIPVGGPMRRTSVGRVLFAGDAGGFVNAITAEGIYYAMVSGDLAARAIVAQRGVDGERPGPTYERLWRAELGTELRDATVLQRYLFSSHARVARVLRGAARAPWLTDLILQYTRGELPYSSVRRRVLLRFPLTALKLARERFIGGSKSVS